MKNLLILIELCSCHLLYGRLGGLYLLEHMLGEGRLLTLTHRRRLKCRLIS
jgi:hypothetical protein